MARVSVIIPAYNNEKTISQAIDSILTQTYTDYEIIICDDCSKDGTYGIAKRYSEGFPNIVAIKNDVNLGAGLTRNNCIEKAVGEFIALQDADDLSLPERLQEQISFLDINPDFAMVGTGCDVFNKTGAFSTIMPMQYPTAKSFLHGLPFMHPTLVIRRDALLFSGLYKSRSEVARSEDYEFAGRLYSMGYKGCTIQRVLLKYRVEDEDYKKRTFLNRVRSVKVRYMVFKALQFRWYKSIYALKPLIAGLIPKEWLKNYHRRKYKLQA